MSEYNTEQKRLLLEFLREHSDSSFTIDDIVEAIKLSAGKAAPGRSTVYRLMTKLVEERTVQRFADEHGRSFLYRIIADEHCRTHLHLKCLQCGRILHLDRKTSETLLESVRKVKDFSVSEEDTLLFGNCAQCREGREKAGGRSDA